MNARLMKPAVIIAIAVPRKGAGTSAPSSRSRMPANSTSARVKPTEEPKPNSSDCSRSWPSPTPPGPPRSAKGEEIIVPDPTAAQTHVYLGHLGVTRNHPDFYPLLVMDNVLGTGPGFTDRLSATLRDRQGLAYTVTAQIAASASEQPGTFTGYIGTFPDKYLVAREGFLTEIGRIRREAPWDETSGRFLHALRPRG